MGQNKFPQKDILSLTAVENSPCGILIVDGDRKIVLINKELERIFSYPREELLGQSIEMLVPEHSREKHSNYRKQYWGNPSTRLMGGGRDLYGRRKDGTEIPLEIGLNPVDTDEGRFVLCAIVDISARKKAERALQDAAEELKRSNRQLEQFAYIASHDLQEPLRVIAGFLDLLSERYKPQLDEKARTYIGFATDAAKRMSQLITDLLKYSRVERGAKEPKRVDLNRCLQIAIANLQASIQEAGSTITCEELPTVRGNETQLIQLFQNLVGNAIKFRRNDIPSQIHVGHQAGNDHWVISIRDNGIGIAPEHHRKIFLIFQRLHGKKEYPGTGIGLALCEKIADQHGGRIWVDSDPGKGSTFYFTLPFHNPLN
jgi:PAS domain S-box-containing protein